MRQNFIPDQSTKEFYRAALHNDLGVYHVQSGGGFGGFLKNVMSKYVIPIGKTLFKKGFEIAKPELQNVGQKAIASASRYGIKQMNIAANKLQERVGGSRRKLDALDD